jgi:A/G-specific adenine glycosylase
MPNKLDKEIPRRLLDWYQKNRRDLPWRRTKDPYRIWVSEIMLQQTRVDTVIPYYKRFLTRFPSLKALARASLDDVLKAWENLGYYSRARHLHEAARIVTEQFNGRMPSTREDLRKLPGIGAYTAGAILSIAFGKPVAAVDGNVIRVMTRLFGIEDPIDGGNTRKRIGELSERLVPDDLPGHYNQALMDLGSGICTPRDPGCPNCPLSMDCRARKKGKQKSIPIKKTAEEIPHREAAVALLCNGTGQFLMIKRPQKGLLGGLWGFPECVLEKGGAPAATLRKSLRQELGLNVISGKEIFLVEHGYSHFSITVHVFAGKVREATPAAKKDLHFRWVSMKGFSRIALSGLERKILKRIQTLPLGEKPFADGQTGAKRVK